MAMSGMLTSAVFLIALLFGTAALFLVLGALLTFATRPLHARYLGTTVAWGLSPLEDQQLRGVIMWIAASLIHLAALCVLFVA